MPHEEINPSHCATNTDPVCLQTLSFIVLSDRSEVSFTAAK